MFEQALGPFYRVRFVRRTASFVQRNAICSIASDLSAGFATLQTKERLGRCLRTRGRSRQTAWIKGRLGRGGYLSTERNVRKVFKWCVVIAREVALEECQVAGYRHRHA